MVARVISIDQAVSVDQRLSLNGGRIISWCTYGRPGGFPVLSLHGTPGSRLKYRSADQSACEHGLRLISPDRWGYGASDAPLNASVSKYAEDIEALVDALGIDRFAVVGISGGGPFAVAVAARLGVRITALALVAPVGPIAAIPAHALSPFHRLSFRIIPRVPGALRTAFAVMRAAIRIAPNMSAYLATARAGAADCAIMRCPAIRADLNDTFIAGLAGSALGPALDMKLFSRPWNIAFDQVSAPVCIWIGADDRNVPLAAINELARNLPAANIVRLPAAGHFWIVQNYAQVLSWIAAPGEHD